jgi:hypothetical protein
MKKQVVITSIAAFVLITAACEDKRKELLEKTGGDAASPFGDAASIAPRDAAPAAPASYAMPERPVPKPETMVSQSAPEETQMKAMTYMVAMRAPHPDDPNADEAYATEVMNKLKPISMAIDTGPDKSRWNRTEVIAGGRQVDMYMSLGCEPKTPFNAVVQRANIPLAVLRSRGILVVRCYDTKKQCLQSTRDPDDVLCTTVIRHK